MVYTFFGGLGGASVEDTNGNMASSLVDDLGRAVTFTETNSFPSSVTVPGLTNAYTITPVSAASNFTVQSTNLDPDPNACTASTVLPPESGSQTTIATLTLPNGEKYQFQYDPTYGVLSKVVFPSGGYISYTWGLNPMSQFTSLEYQKVQVNGITYFPCYFRHDFYAVTHRYVSYDGVNVALQQDFSYSTTWNASFPTQWQSKQTTVTTHDLVRPGQPHYDTIYTYVPFTLPPQIPFDNPGGQTSLESVITYKGTSGTVLKTVRKNWLTQYELAGECETLEDGSIRGTFYSYGTGIQVTDKKEFGFGVISAGSCNLPTATPTRETITTYQPFQKTPKFPTVLSVFDRPATVKVYGSGTLQAETDFGYDQSPISAVTPGPTDHDEANYSATSTNPRGNVTTITRQCFPSCSNSVTRYTYDETGQVASLKDPNGNTTLYSYADNYTSGLPPGNTNAYLKTITRPPTNGVSHIQTFSYSYSDGKLTQSMNENLHPTTYKYIDSLDRFTEADFPDGGKTSLSYNDSSPTPSVTTTTLITASQSLVTVATMDGVGHVIKSQITSDPDGSDTVAKTYDGTNRIYTVTNPYRSTSDSSYGVTTYTYDSLGRTMSVQNPDGTAAQSTYSGSSTTVTDEAAKARKTVLDGLGRIVQVFESPTAFNYETDYQYDILNDLLSVSQKGGSTNSANWRPRSFVYNSLSELTTSNNPESGRVGYAYDLNGNLVARTSPAQNQTGTATVTLSYCYDALNRIVSKAYTLQSCPMPSPVATYTYDQGATSANPIGRRTGMADAAGSEIWTYDVMGRVATDQRTTSGVAETMTYAPYNLDGSVKAIIYPSGHTFTYTYTAAAKQLSVVDTTGGISFVTGAHYAPHGALASMTRATNVSSTYIFNSRLQPCWIYATTSTALPWNTTSCTGSATAGTIIDLKNNFNLGSTDNGNVVGVTNNRDSTRGQSFGYDSLNRLILAETTSTFATSPTHCWGEAYQYDNQTTGGGWGNLTNIAGASPSYTGCVQESGLSVAILPNNQLSSGNGYAYDAAGNLTAATFPGPASYTYDAENHLITAGGVTYSYDGDGKRVTKSTGKIYWYDSSGNVISELNAGGTVTDSYVFFAGQRVVHRSSTAGIFYDFDDHLGTSRAIILSGQTAPCYDADFYPFGGERPYINTCLENYKFTGKERDAESGLDDFGARYSSSSMGRFVSPDPAGMFAVNLRFPQTLNRYSYVMGNPLTMIDPLGLDCVYLNNQGNGVEWIDQNSNFGECGTHGGYWVEGTLTGIQIDSESGHVMLWGTTTGLDANGNQQYTFAQYQDTTLNVGWYKNDFVNRLGHIAIGIGDATRVGLNPASDARFILTYIMNSADCAVTPGCDPASIASTAVPGAVLPQDPSTLVQNIPIPITGMQATLIQDAINQGTQSPPDYSLLAARPACDCGTWAQGVMSACGLKSGPAAASPPRLIGQLVQIYGGR